jgi:pyrimidine operon attenuation protein/uracil phosphoribosyltransferase
MDFIEKAVVMTAADMNRVLARMASQVVENNPDLSNVLLVGIRRRGVPLAEKIAVRIKEMDGVDVATGALDITLYRDDLSTVAERPVINKTELPANITGRTIILVDDVLYTGRTIRAALDELIDFGRPRRVQLAVLIDRGWRELPIQADYIGKFVTTTEREIIKVMLPEYDETEQVLLVEQI